MLDGNPTPPPWIAYGKMVLAFISKIELTGTGYYFIKEEHHMTTQKYHLAQLNIGSMLGPIDGEIMSGFVARLDEINALADGYEGFVWRLQTEDGDATALRPYEDERIIVNMSVWESIDALFDYVYKSTHRELLKYRIDWFSHMKDFYMCMWWIPAGTIPTTDEAKHRLAYMTDNGITPYAFTFKHRHTVDEMLAYQIAENL